MHVYNVTYTLPKALIAVTEMSKRHHREPANTDKLYNGINSTSSIQKHRKAIVFVTQSSPPPILWMRQPGTDETLTSASMETSK